MPQALEVLEDLLASVIRLELANQQQSTANPSHGCRSMGASTPMKASTALPDPSAADHDLIVVEHRRLTGGNRSLRLVEGDENFVLA